MPVAVRMLLCFLLLWQFFFHVSDAGMGVLILFLHHFFHMMASAHPGQYLQNICKVWPKSFLGALKIIHTALAKLNSQSMLYVPVVMQYMTMIGALSKEQMVLDCQNLAKMCSFQTILLLPSEKNVGQHC